MEDIKKTKAQLIAELEELRKRELGSRRIKPIESNSQNHPELLDLFFKHTLDCVVLLDKEFNFIRVNEAYAKVCQREVSEFPGHNHFEFYPSDAKAIFEDVVKTKEPFEITARPFTFPDHPEWGVTYWDWTLVPILNVKEEVFLLVYTLKDVTKQINTKNELKKHQEHLDELIKKRTVELYKEIADHKDSEEALKKTEVKYHLLFEKMLNGYAYCKMIFNKDNKPIDWIYLDINDSFERITGLKKDVIGKKVTEAIPGIKKDVPKLFEIYGKVALTGEEASFEIYLDTLKTWFKVLAFSLKENYFVATFEDITERKKAEEALRESEKRYKRLFEQSNDAVFIHDFNGRIIDVNQRVCEMLGYNKEQLLSINIINLHPKKELPNSKKAFHTTKEKGSVRFETRFIKKDGSELFVDISSRIIDEKNSIVQGIARDITERKKAEKDVINLSKFPSENPNPVLRIDVEGKILYTNETVDSLLKENNLSKKQIYNILPKNLKKLIKEALKTGKTKSYFEVQVDSRIYSYNLTPIIENQYVNLYGRDITEHKQIEVSLREKDEFNFALFQHNPIETIVTDLEGKVVKCNIAKKKSGGRIPNIGDVMYRDYAGKHEIDMYTELLECIRTNKLKKFPEKKYGDRFLTINISPFPHGAIITSQDITELKEVEKSLKASGSELKKQKSALEQKTIALREVIGEIEEEKNKIKDDITANVNEVLIPVLERLELSESSNKYIDLLKHHLKKLTSSFRRKITTKSVNLTPREIEICTMVESGLTNKEISKLLSISCHTVETHRNSIREKFNITNKNINLSSFLQQL